MISFEKMTFIASRLIWNGGRERERTTETMASFEIQNRRSKFSTFEYLNLSQNISKTVSRMILRKREF